MGRISSVGHVVPRVASALLLLVLAACGGTGESTEPESAATEVAQTADTQAGPSTTQAGPGGESSTTTPATTTVTTEPAPELVDTEELVAALLAVTTIYGEPINGTDARCFAEESAGLVRVEPAVALLATGDPAQALIAMAEHGMEAVELQAAADALRACFPETLFNPEFGNEVPSYFWILAVLLEAQI